MLTLAVVARPWERLPSSLGAYGGATNQRPALEARARLRAKNRLHIGAGTCHIGAGTSDICAGTFWRERCAMSALSGRGGTRPSASPTDSAGRYLTMRRVIQYIMMPSKTVPP